MDLVTLIAGPAGGLLGLAGSLVQKWLGMKEKVADHKMEMERLELASRIDLQKADINLRSTIEEKAGESLKAAIDAQAALKPAHPWARTFLSLFRPGLTLLLWVSAMVLAIWNRDVNPEMMEYIVTATFSMFTVSMGYWFGSRDNFKRLEITRAVR